MLEFTIAATTFGESMKLRWCSIVCCSSVLYVLDSLLQVWQCWICHTGKEQSPRPGHILRLLHYQSRICQGLSRVRELGYFVVADAKICFCCTRI